MKCDINCSPNLVSRVVSCSLMKVKHRTGCLKLSTVKVLLYRGMSCLSRLLLGSPHNHFYWLNTESFWSNSTAAKWKVKVPVGRNKRFLAGWGLDGGKHWHFLSIPYQTTQEWLNVEIQIHQLCWMRTTKALFWSSLPTDCPGCVKGKIWPTSPFRTRLQPSPAM